MIQCVYDTVMVEEIYWWHREAMLFLRSRKRGLSLHDFRDTERILEFSEIGGKG